MQQVNARPKLAATAYDRSMTTKLCGRHAVERRQPDRSDDRHGEDARHVRQPGPQAVPGQFVNIRLLLNTLHNQTYVPAAAIQHGAQGTYVYVVDKDRTANMRTVTTGPTDGDKVAITSGLKPGETVVVDGADRLQGRRNSAAAGRQSARSHRFRRDVAESGRQVEGQARRTSPSSPRRRRQRRRPMTIRYFAACNESGDEPVASLHSTACRDIAPDDRDHARRHRRLRLSAAVGAARSRLSDDPGADLPSRRQPRSDDDDGHRAAGTSSSARCRASTR